MEIQALGSFKIEFPLQRELDFDVFYRFPQKHRKWRQNGSQNGADIDQKWYLEGFEKMIKNQTLQKHEHEVEMDPK